MHVELTEEQQALSSVLEDIFTRHCPPSVVRAMKEPDADRVPAELWKALADADIFGLPVSAEFGGADGSLIDLSQVFVNGGRVICPTSVYSTLCFALALNRLGADSQKAAYLPGIASGQLLATLAVADPQDFTNLTPSLRATRSGDGWHLSGELMFVPNAKSADVVLVTATTGRFLEPSSTGAFLVTPGRPGWTDEPLITMAGDRQSRVVLDRYLVPEADAILGEDGRGLDLSALAWVAQAAIALQCAEAIGGAGAVIEATVQYLKARIQFGRPLASFQAAQHHIANLTIAHEQARVATYLALSRLSRSQLAPRSVAIAKLLSGESYKTTTLTAHQLHGGMGYVRETDLHLWSERAKVAELSGGTADDAAAVICTELGLSGAPGL